MLVLLVLAVLFPSPFQARQAAAGPARDYQDPEAYIVYSTILPSDWIIRDSHAKHLVILRETRVYHMCLRPEPEFEQTVGPAIKDYTRINASAWLLQDKFDTALSHELVSNEQLKSTLGKGDWENFHAYYPDSKGFLEFSAVGFNEDKTIAVVSWVTVVDCYVAKGDFTCFRRRMASGYLLSGRDRVARGSVK